MPTRIVHRNDSARGRPTRRAHTLWRLAAVSSCLLVGLLFIPSASQSAGASSSGGGSFGTLGQLCGSGKASGSTAQGVTKSGIDIATITDVAWPVDPGLFQSVQDVAEAFTKWCNAAGGIDGRPIKLDFYDAKGTEDAAMMQQACAKDFALVGDLEVEDQTGLPVREACKLPEIAGGTVSDAASDAPLRVSVYPSPSTSVDDSEFVGSLHEFPSAKRLGFLTGNTPSDIDVTNREADGAKKLGFDVVYNETFPLTGLVNPQSYVLQMKADGVQVFSLTGNGEEVAQIEEAMSTVGWYPSDTVLNAALYDPSLIQAGGSALKNTFVEFTFRPFQDPNAALNQMESIIKSEVPGSVINAYTLRSFSSWLLFAEAAKQCGSDLTRSCLLDKAASEPKWDDGGIGGLTHLTPKGQTAPVCNVDLEATAQGFVIASKFLPPTSGDAPFNCDPKNVVKI